MGIEEQTKQTLAAIDRVLALAKTEKKYLLSAMVYLRGMSSLISSQTLCIIDMSDYAAMNKVLTHAPAQ